MTENAEAAKRHRKRIAAAHAAKGGLMSNSKWLRLFETLRLHTGRQYGVAKMLGMEQTVHLALWVYDETWSDSGNTLRGYSGDWISGPLKLSEIEWIHIDLPSELDRNALTEALNRSGRYAFEYTNGGLKIYGYRGQA